MTTPEIDDISARVLLALGLTVDDQWDLDTAVRPVGEEVHLTPGAVVAERFRITALLGRGGMGEVYRAEDLKLGQTVALKFLPASISPDPELIRSFYDEVRIGRQVAHPNVCRIYDLLEVEGRPAIVMEFVEGENLASLLTRAGQLPYVTALQIARDIVAGVEAAHERRVIHGDLKPSNIMIDGRGRARITDFGLSRIAEEQGPMRVAGTIAYMAPEQFTTGAASELADLYSLGMVLYEVFTSMRARQVSGANDPAFTKPPVALSAVQPAIDRNLERTILRCLMRQPNERPPSASTVRAAFPPGDILDAVMAAGEVPPAEFVAESGRVRELQPRTATLFAVAAVALLLLVVVLCQKLTLYGRTPLRLSGEVLSRTAQQMIAAVSYAVPGVDHDAWFAADLDSRWDPATKLPAILFHYRSSASPIVTTSRDHDVRELEPLARGMVDVTLAADGRLLSLKALPLDAPKPAGTVDWHAVFQRAGLKGGVSAVPPSWTPSVPFDELRQWTVEGTVVRGAGFRGRVTEFEVVRPAAEKQGWTMRESKIPDAVYFAVLLASLVFGSILARRNIRRGSVDTGAAWRIALWVSGARILFDLIAGHHPATPPTELRFVSAIAGIALLLAAQVWLGYAAFEPYVRRRWPEAMIGWARLVHGRVRDGIVGRALIGGTIAGLSLRLIDQLRNVWPASAPARAAPSHLAVDALISIRETIGNVFLFQARAIFFGFLGIFVLVLLRMALRHRGLAALAWLVLATAARMRWDDPIVELLVVGMQMAVVLLVLQRVGLLAMIAALYVHLLTVYTPLTADPTAFYAPQAAVGVVVVLAIVAFGWHAATFTRATLTPSP